MYIFVEIHCEDCLLSMLEVDINEKISYKIYL